MTGDDNTPQNAAGFPYRVLSSDLLAFGGVKPKQVTWPKKYPNKKKGEVTFKGAGILPVCVFESDDGKPEMYALVQKRLKGNKDPSRWFDFGGKKREKEYPSACACRHFAKQTYGMFGLDAPHLEDADGTVDDLAELYHTPGGATGSSTPANLPLMVKTCEKWAQSQVSGDLVFMHAEQNYFFYVIQVPFIETALLDAASEAIDGKRHYEWIECQDLCSEPLTQRLHVSAFMQEAASGFAGKFTQDMDMTGRAEYTVHYVGEDDEKR